MDAQRENEILAMIHEEAEELEEAGLIDKQTMRDYDDLCFPRPTKLTPEEIRKLREEAKVSQAVFGRFLNVSKNVISQWERGIKPPSNMGLKLLYLVKKYGLKGLA